MVTIFSGGNKSFILLSIFQQILVRLCAWWNPGVSDFGSWDINGCEVVESTDSYTTCVCDHFGTYAILAEKTPEKVKLYLKSFFDLLYDIVTLLKVLMHN